MDKYKNFSQSDLVLMVVACEEGGNLKLLKELENALAEKEKEGGKEKASAGKTAVNISKI